MCETNGGARAARHTAVVLGAVALWALLGFVAAAASADGPFTLAEVLAPPFPVSLATASQADRVAWVRDDRGSRNVWTAAPGDPARPVTGYTGDDGQPLGALSLTPDGEWILYVRGGGANRLGEHPNPTSDPRGVERSVWIVSSGGGEPRRLGEGASPVVSPNGREVLIARDGGLFRAPLHPTIEDDGAGQADGSEPQRLFEARGASSGAAYSPDGRRVAFVSDRGDHSFIGVYDLEAERLSWIAPSVDRDDFPVWSPDGRRLAFIRQDGQIRGELFSFLVTRPFRLMVADVESSGAVELWRSPDRGGPFAQLYPGRPLRWAGERLVFFSEHDGWMHVYSLAASGGAPVDLTPGQCEAEHSDIDPSGAWLVFSHNCDGIDRRQVSVTQIAGGGVSRLGPEREIHSSPRFSAEGETIYLRASDARRPATVTRVGRDGSGWTRLDEPGPASLPPLDALVVPRAVTLLAADGLTTHGQLFEPRGPAPPGGRPALVFMHGGPMRQMLLGWHYIQYYARCYAFNQYMASRGWMVLSVNFRSGIGYGQDFRLAPEQGPYGASEYQDVVAAGEWLRDHEAVDPLRVALWGGSYGGYLTAMGLARDSDLFAAGVDLHGVHDWALRATDFTPGGGWGISEDDMELARRSSPVADLSSWTSPVLFVHGDDDRNVLFQQTTDLVVRLRRRGLEPEVLVLPDEVHGFLRHASWLRVFEAAAEFLERRLGAAAG